MNFLQSLPGRRETLICLLTWAFYYIVLSMFMDIRPEHFGFSALFLLLFFASAYTRKLAMCLIPFVLFGMSYDFMRVYPNYLVNEVDISGIYETEKSVFGIVVDGNRMTLNEFFSIHNCSFADFWAGIFYLCWVPAPIAFGIYCFVVGKRQLFLRFAWAFLLINVVGFCGYYVHPASPPWFYAQNGGGEVARELLGSQMGSEAGLARFDHLLGLSVFHDIYSKNANVFAAVPSLHSTYCLCAFIYALVGRTRWYVALPLGVIALGICWTAVYTGHHYTIDVLLGIALTFVVILLWEKLVLHIPSVERLFQSYARYVG